MRKIISILLIIFSTSLVAQQKDIEKLISEIDNSQMSVVEKGDDLILKMNSEAGKKLIRNGKVVTLKLIDVLNNPKKGLIAHYILSLIWKNNWGQSSCGGNTKVVVSEINYIIYNGLRIERNPDNSVYSKEENLRKRKSEWEKFQKIPQN
jgi:hypothetical protein